MDYQISYFSPLGYAKKLADAFAKELPTAPEICNLELESFCSAKIHLVGFEYSLNETVPAKAMDFLESLRGISVSLSVMQLNRKVQKLKQWKKVVRQPEHHYKAVML